MAEMKCRYFFILTGAALLLVIAGCGGGKKACRPPLVTQEKSSGDLTAHSARETRQQQTGSLWHPNQGSLFEENKACHVGDILTVAIYEQASAEKEAETTTERSSSVGMGIPKLFGYEAALAAKNPNLDPGSMVSASTENNFEGNGSTSREERLTATLTTRVVEKVEAGN